MALTELGRYAERDSLVRLLGGYRDRMTPAQRYRLEVAEADVRGDRWGRYRSLQKWVTVDGSDRARGNLASMAMVLGRHTEAVELFRSIDPEGLTALVNPWFYWKNFQAALHFVGRHGEELRVAREARQRHPEDAAYLMMQTEALAPLGRVTTVKLLLDSIMTLVPGRPAGGAIFTAAYEFWLHGHDAPARDLFEQTLAWLRSQPDSEQRSPEHRQFFYHVLYTSQRWEEAAAFFEQERAFFIEKGVYQEWETWAEAGKLAAREEKRDEAIEVAERLRGVTLPHRQWNVMMERAKIASILGEREEAIRLLQETISRGYNLKLLHHAMIDFPSLRGYPPFEAMQKPRD